MFCRNEEKTASENNVTGLAAEVVRIESGDFSDQEVCIAVAYRPDGHVGPGLRAFLRAFKEQNIQVILCLIVEKGAQPPTADSTCECSAVLIRQNQGYDFGAWAGTLRALPQIWAAKRVYFVNDSILGPNHNFVHLISAIRNDGADFVSLTAGTIDKYHAQTYFFVYGERALSNPDLQAAWLQLPDYTSKVEVIKKCEQAQLERITELQLRSTILFSLSDMVVHLPKSKISRFSPTHHAWRELALRGFPFLKADLFHRPKWSTVGWSEFFPGSARGHVQQQLRENIAARKQSAKGHKMQRINSPSAVAARRVFNAARSLGKKALVEFRCAWG